MPVDQNFPRTAQDQVNLIRAGYYKIDKGTQIRNETSFTFNHSNKSPR